MGKLYQSDLTGLVIIPESGCLSIVRRATKQYNQSMVRERDRKSLWAIHLGLGSNIILSAVKTIFGMITHSPALLAEASIPRQM
jgi:hypothetical protein